MSVGTSPQARTLARALPVGRDATAIAAVLGLCTMLTVISWRAWGDLWTDAGYDLLAASRIGAGELPYVDFTYYYGPLGVGVVGLGASLSDSVLGTAIAVGVAVATLIVLATYALARTQVGPLGAALAAGITAPLAFAPNNLGYVLPHSFSASFAVLCTLGALLALARYAASGRAAWLLSAGVLAGLVTLTRPEFTLAVVAALALWLTLRARAQLGGIREALLLAAPVVLIPSIVFGLFLTQVPLDHLVFENLYPRDALEGSGNRLLRAYAPLTLSSFAVIALKTAVYLAGAAGLVVLALALSRSHRLRRPLLAAAVLAAATLVVVAAARTETLRYYLEFVYAWIPAGAILGLIVLLRRFRSRREPWSAADQVALVGVAILAVLGAKTYNAFLFHAPEPQFAVYAAPFAAIFLARLHLRELVSVRAAYVLGALWLGFLGLAGATLTAKDSRAKSAEVTGSRGWLRDAPEDARALDAALGWIERETRPGDYVLVGPQLQALYVLTGRRNPLEELSLLPGALGGREGELTAAAELDRRRVRLVVIDGRTFPEFGHTSFGGSFNRTLAAWIADRFEPVSVLEARGEKTRKLTVWLRLPEGS